MPTISFPRRLADLAQAAPDAPAVTCAEVTLSRRELGERASVFAQRLAELGVTQGDMVTIALPNSTEFFVATVAAWLLGAIPQPVSSRLPARELEAVVELADSQAVVGVAEGTIAGRACIPKIDLSGIEPRQFPDVMSSAWKAPTSGGSTGRPKLIVSGDPAAYDTEAPVPLLLGNDGSIVMPGPMYHNGPFIWAFQKLLAGGHVVLLPRFDAEGTLAAIERYRADVVYLVPTMMRRIWRLAPEARHRYDLSSLRVAWHLAEPCPAWLKQAWIDWLGAERIYELYGGTEGQASTVISGTDWLQHRGSVGRPAMGEISIRDAEGQPLPAGQEGEVWLRPTREGATYRYVGATARRSDDGWESLGDIGWLDQDGFLYLGDRASDMIVSGGANIYPAEVESAIQEHPAVRSCAVIGLPDDDLGARVHGLVEVEGALEEDDLRTFLGERLVRYKVPRTFEWVDQPLRDEAGKVRRGALRAQRISPEEGASAGR